jgi:hypothetical protein
MYGQYWNKFGLGKAQNGWILGNKDVLATAGSSLNKW